MHFGHLINFSDDAAGRSTEGKGDFLREKNAKCRCPDSIDDTICPINASIADVDVGGSGELEGLSLDSHPAAHMDTC